MSDSGYNPLRATAASRCGALSSPHSPSPSGCDAGEATLASSAPLGSPNSAAAGWISRAVIST